MVWSVTSKVSPSTTLETLPMASSGAPAARAIRSISRQHKEGFSQSHGFIPIIVSYSYFLLCKNGLLILFSGKTT